MIGFFETKHEKKKRYLTFRKSTSIVIMHIYHEVELIRSIFYGVLFPLNKTPLCRSEDRKEQ